MSTHLVPQSRYTNTALSNSSVYDIQASAEHGAKVTEITKVANHEVAQIGAHAIGTMAQLVVGAASVQHQLTDSGIRSPVYDDAQAKLLQVTGQNLITLANAAQKEVLQSAAQLMR